MKGAWNTFLMYLGCADFFYLWNVDKIENIDQSELRNTITATSGDSSLLTENAFVSLKVRVISYLFANIGYVVIQ